MREIEILGRHFSDKDVQVKFIENTTPKTNGKEILLPADMPQKVAPSVLAVLMHESYHIKKASRQMEQGVKKLMPPRIKTYKNYDFGVFHDIMNIVEDVRIDRIVLSDYKGAKRLYEEELKELSKKQAKSPVASAIASAMIEATGFDSSILPPCPQEVLPLKEEILSILQKIPVKSRGGRKKIAEVVVGLYDLLKNYFQKPQPPQPPQPPAQPEETPPDDEEEDEKENQEEENTLPAQPEETPPDDEEEDEKEEDEKKEQREKTEESEEALCKEEEQQEEEQQEEQGEVEEELTEDGIEEKIEEVMKEVKKQSIGIHQIERILQEAEKNPREVKISPAIAKRLLLQKIENRKGNLKINTKRASSLYTAPAKIFQSVQKKTEKTIIYLVVDISASMWTPMEDNSGKRRSDITEEALYSIVQATQSIPSNKLDLRVLFFNDRVFAGFPKEILKKKFPFTDGTTIPALPLQKIISEHPKKARVIMITDADFQDGDAEEIERTLKQHPYLDFLGVVIGENRRSERILSNNAFLRRKFSIVRGTKDLQSIFSQVL